MAPLTRRRMTVEEFVAHVLSDEERRELINGKVVRTPVEAGAHDLVARRLTGALQRQLRGRPWRVRTDAAVCFGRWNALCPDVVVVHEAFDHAGPVVAEPVIIAEITVADGVSGERSAKWDHYRTLESLQHFLLIAADAPRVELFTRRDDSSWWYRNYDDGLHHMLALGALDICLLLTELYEGVTFDGPAPSRA